MGMHEVAHRTYQGRYLPGESGNATPLPKNDSVEYLSMRHTLNGGRVPSASTSVHRTGSSAKFQGWWEIIVHCEQHTFPYGRVGCRVGGLRLHRRVSFSKFRSVSLHDFFDSETARNEYNPFNQYRSYPDMDLSVCHARLLREEGLVRVGWKWLVVEEVFQKGNIILRRNINFNTRE